MDDLDSSSDTSSVILESQQDARQDLINGTLNSNELNEVVEDLTTAASDPSSSDEALPRPSRLHDGPPAIISRPYQLEMLEESLRRNIIVAMDTGSGKTHRYISNRVLSAILRILHELDCMKPDQLIWFLASSVILCSQHYETLQTQITSVTIKFLSGADGVDRWRSKAVWDIVLRDVKVVVSTYQILQDALDHGIFRMQSLALVVFDEAHNCVGNYPGAKLMHTHYHLDKSLGKQMPHVLGLTASPLMRSDPESLNKIEETLDAICRTPKKHRAELMQQVKLPVLRHVHYESIVPASLTGSSNAAIHSLSEAINGLKLSEDPYIIRLREENSERSRRNLDKALLSQKTWCRDQLKTLYTTSLRIRHDLGDWAADYYISEVVTNVQNKIIQDSDVIIGILDVSRAEKEYVRKALVKVQIAKADLHTTAIGLPMVSNKVEKLIQVLVEEHASNFSGIIFVQERATTEVLARLLSVHPNTKDKFTIGTVVGASQHSIRARNISELVDPESQKHVLGRFRAGQVNLVIATSVLEEGIDIPSCNVVICFQKPANLKSFVQRRGRARHEESKLILLIDSHDEKLEEFQQLEKTMKKIYADEMRELTELMVFEDSDERGTRSFRIEHTGANINLDNAVAHLYHFCATLPAKEFVDLRPEFICSREGNLVRARVILPLSVDQAVRNAQSKALWKSEKNAIKDAAFEAYVALYHVGLLNDNLLPLIRNVTDLEQLNSTAIEKRASIIAVDEQLNPWIAVSRAWEDLKLGKSQLVWRIFTSLEDLDFEMLLPVVVPSISPIPLYWDQETELKVTCRQSLLTTTLNDYLNAKGETLALLQAGFGHRFSIQEKMPVVAISLGRDISIRNMQGRHSIGEVLSPKSSGLVRDIIENQNAYIYREWLPYKPPRSDVQIPYEDFDSTPHHQAHLSVKRLTRRRDFLHKVVGSSKIPSRKLHSAVLPATRCTVDIMPFEIVRLSILLPSIIHRLEISLIAHELSTTLLKDVGISDLSLVTTAICASSACEETNYQRLEFLGDSILKLCTSIQLMAEYPLWYEGLLSAKKDRIVSNSRLTRAAIESGLDKFIIVKQFTGQKWRPLYVEDMIGLKQNSKRDLSSKVVADVVEALIGAAMVDGGFPKALSCLRVFLPDLDWQPLEVRQSFLYRRAPDLQLPIPLQLLEKLLGYEFKNKTHLIEAMSHASCNSGTGSLERVEFLGDAILDNVIGTVMFPHNLSQMQMHLIRTALVNADFLAFTCMEWSIERETYSVEEIPSANPNAPPAFKTIVSSSPWPLWRFMRHMSPALGAVQSQNVKRHSKLRDDINTAIKTGTSYPWALLARLQAHKFFSDIVESILGAVWIDSGSFETCTEIVERMGILSYFQRILEEKVQILHPKEELGMLADTETVKYVIRDRKTKGYEAASVEYLCTILIGGREIVSVEGGVSRDEVRTKAAEEAVRMLKLRKVVVKDGGGEGEDEDQDMGGVDIVEFEKHEGVSSGAMVVDG